MAAADSFFARAQQRRKDRSIVAHGSDESATFPAAVEAGLLTLINGTRVATLTPGVNDQG
jgi:hypothetical protein